MWLAREGRRAGKGGGKEHCEQAEGVELNKANKVLERESAICLFVCLFVCASWLGPIIPQNSSISIPSNTGRIQTAVGPHGDITMIFASPFGRCRSP